MSHQIHRLPHGWRGQIPFACLIAEAWLADLQPFHITLIDPQKPMYNTCMRKYITDPVLSGKRYSGSHLKIGVLWEGEDIERISTRHYGNYSMVGLLRFAF